MAKHTDSILLEGRNMVHDALNSGQEIESVTTSEKAVSDPKVGEIIKLARSKNIPIKIIPAHELNRMAQTESPQGVLAYMKLPDVPSLEGILRKNRSVFILLLSHVDYEQNLGAILRSAWAAGVDAVVISPSGVREITPVVAKISMGAAAFVPLIPMSLFQALKLLHKYAVKVIGVEVEMGKPLYEENLSGPIAFLIGGEAEGISQPLQKECDLFVHIPMKKEVASLNMSVATALTLFEKVRQESLDFRS